MIETITNLTCPHCNKTYDVEMPLSYCQIAFDCLKCGNIIVPLKGDCCIFCSYADKPCPPKQK